MYFSSISIYFTVFFYTSLPSSLYTLSVWWENWLFLYVLLYSINYLIYSRKTTLSPTTTVASSTFSFIHTGPHYHLLIHKPPAMSMLIALLGIPPHSTVHFFRHWELCVPHSLPLFLILQGLQACMWGARKEKGRWEGNGWWKGRLRVVWITQIKSTKIKFGESGGPVWKQLRYNGLSEDTLSYSWYSGLLFLDGYRFWEFHSNPSLFISEIYLLLIYMNQYN